MRLLAVIPARGGSKRIPGKNLAALGGRPLIDYTLDAARTATSLDAVVVSTDDEAIAAHVRRQGTPCPWLRPADLATDTSTTLSVLQHALMRHEQSGEQADAVVVLQPTSPFRTGAHIDGAVARFRDSGADTLTSVRDAAEHPYWAWTRTGALITPFFTRAEATLDRHRLPPALVENGAIYIVRRDVLVRGELYGERVAGFEMDEYSSIDIDSPADIAWAEFRLERAREGARR